jgi:hypothetical protein
MLPIHFANKDDDHTSIWRDLSDGAPTIYGFANLCGRALQHTVSPVAPLMSEANAILAAAAQRGVMDIRGSKNGFDAADRFLAVCVELAEDRRLLFKRKENPRQTMRFLEGFRQLCQSGVVLHHLQRDFSLTEHGFEAALKVDPDGVAELLEFAVEIDY